MEVILPDLFRYTTTFIIHFDVFYREILPKYKSFFESDECFWYKTQTPGRLGPGECACQREWINKTCIQRYELIEKLLFF